MRLLFLYCLFFTYAATAQSTADIKGKWKVIAIKGEDMYVNLKKDSVALYGELAGKADKEQTKLLAASIIRVFSSGYYIFDDKGGFEMLFNNQSNGAGTYTVDMKEKMITTIVARNGIAVKEKMSYNFIDQHLQLTMQDEDAMQLTLEKVEQKD